MIDGLFDYWGGGYCGATVPNTDSVSQTVTIPAGGHLAFWFASLRVDPDDSALDDYAYICFDGHCSNYDISSSSSNTSFPSGICFVDITLDLSPYVGQTGTLTFGVHSSGSYTGNVRVDDLVFADVLFADGFECSMDRWSVVANSI